MMTNRTVKALVLQRDGKTHVVQRFPVTKQNNGLVISTGECIDLLNLSDEDYVEALRIGVESMIAQGFLKLDVITWKD